MIKESFMLDGSFSLLNDALAFIKGIYKTFESFKCGIESFNWETF